MDPQGYFFYFDAVGPFFKLKSLNFSVHSLQCGDDPRIEHHCINTKGFYFVQREKQAWLRLTLTVKTTYFAETGSTLGFPKKAGRRAWKSCLSCQISLAWHPVLILIFFDYWAYFNRCGNPRAGGRLRWQYDPFHRPWFDSVWKP